MFKALKRWFDNMRRRPYYGRFGSGVTVVPPPPSAPVKTGNPTISSPTLNVGATATAVHGTYTGSVTAYSGQWYRGASPIALATALTYVFASADLGLNITYQESASNSGGSSATGTSNALGPIVNPTLTAPVLTRTSSAGTNPPTWDTVMADLQDGDTEELYFTTNGSTPVIGTPNETHTADAREEAITWATWPSGFANGATVKWAERYGRGGVWSPLSNILSDVMPTPSNVTGINRGIYNINGGFGSGPFTQTGIAIAGGGKVVLTIVFYANPLNGQSMTGVTANSGAITFTRAAGIGATDGKQIWYADVAPGVTNLDLTFTVGGSTQIIDFAVDELSNAAAGGPSSIYRTEHDASTSVDGGLVIPALGIGVIGIWSAGGTAFSGASKKAEGSVDSVGLDLSIAYLAATGAVNVSGPSGNMWIINSAWSH